MNAKALLGTLATGAGTAGLMDRLQYGDYDKDSWSEKRILNALTNFGFGAGGRSLIRRGHGPSGISLIAAAPVKDVAMAALKPIHDWSDLAKQKIESDKAKTVLLGLIGAGALGVGGAAVYNARDAHKKRLSEQNAGNIEVTLPTKNPGDVETQVSLPLMQGRLPKTTLQQIDRDVRRRMRAGGEERTRHRK